MALILTRRPGEMLMIGDDITVAVLGINGNQVKIGISAPPEVAVNREEVHLRIKAEKESAARQERHIMQQLAFTERR